MFDDTLLDAFISNNPNVQITEEDGNVIVDNLWGDSDVRIGFRKEDEQFISDLNAIIVNHKFDAIIHCDDALIEFFFTFIRENDDVFSDLIDRSFSIISIEANISATMVNQQNDSLDFPRDI
jgi:hypothetical protein